MKVRFLFLIILGQLFTFSCQKSKFDVNVSTISVNVKIKRLDKDLFNSTPIDVKKIMNNYSPFFELYSLQILNLGNPTDSLFPQYLQKFTTDKTIIEVKAEVDKKFADLSTTEMELTNTFKHIKYYYPEFKTPTVYTYISGFNQSIVSDSGMVGISLDKYLGADCLFYQYLEVPVYLRSRMSPERIAPDVAEALARMDYAKEMEKADLISSMVYEGKILYFVKAMSPDIPDSVSLNFTNSQTKWLKNNEEKVWTYFIENKKLFESDILEIRKYTGEAPFTAAFGNNSAPRAGQYIGFRIVEEYMQKHPEVSLPQLMTEPDAMKILQQSVYNP